MVKPITKETLFMNCMELDFATKVEIERRVATFEDRVSLVIGFTIYFTFQLAIKCLKHLHKHK